LTQRREDQDTMSQPAVYRTFYRTMKVDGLSIFYREAGSKDAEVHVVDGGHFALDTAADEVAALVRGFVGSSRGELPARRAG
jgi:surfactin synthase thioesterase subunit